MLVRSGCADVVLVSELLKSYSVALVMVHGTAWGCLLRTWLVSVLKVSSVFRAMLMGTLKPIHLIMAIAF